MNEGRILTVKGNVCEPQRINKDEVVVIPHCCNDIGVMGAGVALGLKNKWPKVEKRYSESRLVLGNIFWEAVSADAVVVNMIGQKGVRSETNFRPVKYSALVKAMEETRRYMESQPNSKFVLHCPKFGSDLAGGNWDLILHLIQEIWVEYGYDVVIYEFEPDEEQWGPVGDYSIDVYLDGDNDYIEDHRERFDHHNPDCRDPFAPFRKKEAEQFIPD